MSNLTHTDYASLFLNDTPMIDVRAPIEFEQGAFPHAVNRPLMTNDEREAVGIRYKESGQDAAIDLGHELVHGDIKQQRIDAWREFFDTHPDGLLYCFRGGLRSRVTQQWLQEAGLDVPYVEGGYKAMRRFLLDNLQQSIASEKLTILSGSTGSGKTEIIEQWSRSIDLEGLAKHRGSAFGRTNKPQPAQIDFENAWSINWLKLNQHSDAPVLFEDESRLIGRIVVQPEFLELSKRAPAIVVKADFNDRIRRIRQDYFVAYYEDQDADVAGEKLKEFIGDALTRIRKRLGGERYAQLMATLDAGIADLNSRNGWQCFDDIVATLLNDYYDPMYHYQFQQKQVQVLFEGTHSEILQWLAAHHAI